MIDPREDVLGAVAAATVAEVAWRGADGPVATGVLPLVDGERVVLALPYADAAAARSLGTADEVLLALTEPRGTSPGWTPLALRCRPRLVEDPEGDRFAATLLAQELLRWPPSRLLADSVLLRREHWWWLPRLLVELVVDADGVTALTPREHPRATCSSWTSRAARGGGRGASTTTRSPSGPGRRRRVRARRCWSARTSRCRTASGGAAGPGAAPGTAPRSRSTTSRPTGSAAGARRVARWRGSGPWSARAGAAWPATR